ncbi:MAG: S8 family serine peptidase [Candidatus Altiarchaeia archaeon]
MKKFNVALIFLFFLLIAGLTQTSILGKDLKSSGKKDSTLDLGKIYLSPSAAEYAKKRYPGGQIPLPLSGEDAQFVREYFKENKYIVELRGDPLLLFRKETTDLKEITDHTAEIKSTHKTLYEALTETGEGSGYKVKREYYNVFNGISLENISDAELIALADLSAVEKIYPVKTYHMLLSESVPEIKADRAWTTTDQLGRTVTGKGIKIAVVDTGIDYTHPDLGGCVARINGTSFPYYLESAHPYNNSMNYTWTIKRPGFASISVHFSKIDTEETFDKVIIRNSSGDAVKTYSGYYENIWTPSVPGDTMYITLSTDYTVTEWGYATDLVANGTMSALSDCRRIIAGYNFVDGTADPMDDQGHGTHCASIAAGNGSLKGVAPDASLMAYKVLNSGGSGSEDDIVAGIDQAVSDGADVISLSLGGYGDPDDALSTAVDNAVKAGVVVVVAAGNDGPANASISSPGCARRAITVGAINKADNPNKKRLSDLAVTTKPEKNITSLAFTNSSLTPAGGIIAELADADLGFPNNFTKESFTGKIALIKRGELYFHEKVRNAYNAGAVGAIIYNNYYGIFQGDLINGSMIPVVSVSQEDGEYLLSRLLNETLSVNLSVYEDNSIIADFSSRGPAYIYNKPDILAPGVAICAAGANGSAFETPCKDNLHVYLSGTSMAAPHVAGAAALLIQKNPLWTPMQIKSTLKKTTYDYGYDLNDQGAGKLDIYAAVQLTSPPPVAFISDVSGVSYGK